MDACGCAEDLGTGGFFTSHFLPFQQRQRLRGDLCTVGGGKISAEVSFPETCVFWENRRSRRPFSAFTGRSRPLLATLGNTTHGTRYLHGEKLAWQSLGHSLGFKSRDFPSPFSFLFVFSPNASPPPPPLPRIPTIAAVNASRRLTISSQKTRKRLAVSGNGKIIIKLSKLKLTTRVMNFENWPRIST